MGKGWRTVVHSTRVDSNSIFFAEEVGVFQNFDNVVDDMLIWRNVFICSRNHELKFIAAVKPHPKWLPQAILQRQTTKFRRCSGRPLCVSRTQHTTCFLCVFDDLQRPVWRLQRRREKKKRTRSALLHFRLDWRSSRTQTQQLETHFYAHRAIVVERLH